MLTRALYLSTIWLLLSFVMVLLRGTKPKTGSQLGSLLWLLTVLLAGDVCTSLLFGTAQDELWLTAFGFLFGWWWIWRLGDWNGLAQALWITSLISVGIYSIYTFTLMAFAPMHPLAFVVGMALTLIEYAALALALTYAFESLDSVCRIRWRRRFQPMQPIPGYLPKVSLHVPAYNEPSDVVEATLRSLSQLNYPNFEVLLIDNNTPEESAWRPLEQICKDIGPNFRFLHLDQWPGYKSGALNFGLTQTAPDAEIIGIIDADYRVEPNFLRDMTPFFARPEVAFVQTPQDYRDYHGNAYLEACHYGYKYFFAVSMPSRNEHNAIIFAGTMGLIRRSVLQEIGGWDEWCITEDAEASLRVLKQGYQSVFVNKAYGTGLMPFTFDGLKKQRFRWCFGGIQILKKHWESLLPWARYLDPSNRLTMAQRYYYLVGGLQWFNEPLNLLFAFFLVLGAVLHLSPRGEIVRPLTGPLIVMPVIFLIIGMWRFLWVMRQALHLRTTDAIRTMANYFSLGWAVTLGCIQGFIQPAGVFMRTPKSGSGSSVIRAFRSTQWETLIGMTCVVFAFTVNFYRPQPATIFLSAMLVWQGSLYLSAPYYSLFSIRNKGAEQSLRRIEMPGVQVGESRIARWLLAGAFGIILGIATALLIPGPSQPPDYSRFQPPDVAPPIFSQFGIFTATPTPLSETATVTATSTGVITATSAATLTATPGSSVVPSPTATRAAPTATPLPPSATSLPATSTSVPSATPPPTTDPPPTATLPPPTTPAQLPTQTQSPHPTATPKVSTLAPPSICWIAWNPDTTYPAGAQVSYSGQNWTANVSNRGHPPDNQSDSWSDIGPCFIPSPTPTPTPLF